MELVSSDSTHVPEEILVKWQKMTDLLCRLADVPVTLVMRVSSPNIEVLVASNTEGNPYNVGDSEYLPGSGLYCETVICTRDKLLVSNALADPEWKDNPDIKLGLISYLGFPILRPDGEVFGTLCVLDKKENAYSSEVEELMAEFKELLESHLALILSNAELKDALEKVSDLSERLERAAGTDHLTGLMNRRTFDELIASIQAKEQLAGNRACFVLFDLDHFKEVNDTFGHKAGDAALRHVAETIKRRSRQGDMIWRWGGEEFLIVLPATPLEGGVKFGEELRGALEGEPITHKGGQRHLTMSAGVSMLAENEDPYACLARCDALMYEAKEAGRNRVKAR